MEGINNKLLTTLILLFIPFITFSATFTAVTDGNWHLPATWGTVNSTPGAGDDVVIDGYTVFVKAGNISINSLSLTNNTAVDSSKLDLRGAFTFDITGDLTMTGEDVAEHVQLVVRSNSILNVGGNVLIERVSGNNRNQILNISVYELGRLEVTGTFDYNYRGGGLLESNYELEVYDDGNLTVHGAVSLQCVPGVTTGFSANFYGSATVNFNDDLSLIKAGGSFFWVNVDNMATLAVGKNLKMSNTAGGFVPDLDLNIKNGATVSVEDTLQLTSSSSNSKAVVSLEEEGSTLDLNGYLYFDGQAEGTVGINQTAASNVYLAGNIIQDNEYGFIRMGAASNFYFDGRTPQILPKTRYNNVTLDSLHFTNVFLQNTATNPYILTGNFRVSTHFELTNGILTTTDDTLVIIEDGATTALGNATTYVDGPMMKVGNTGGKKFTFPIGDNGIYAPVTIDTISTSTASYKVSFTGCPPPVGVRVNPLKLVNQHGFWQVERSDGASVGDIALHWNDAQAVGVTDLSSIVVAHYESGVGYTSLGQHNLAGGTGNGVAGAVQNDTGCPPPVGANLFVLGSIDIEENALPVEMSSFIAYKGKDNLEIFLEWETITETNSDYFVIEKSYDGITFHKIAKVNAAGNSSSLQDYSAIDPNPAKGNNYYRIQQVDLDQTMEFSRLINVFINVQGDQPIIYPNPVKDYLRVYSERLEHEDEVLIEIVNINGHALYRGQHVAQDGGLAIASNDININVPGVYFLTIKHKGLAHTMELFKDSGY